MPCILGVTSNSVQQPFEANREPQVAVVEKRIRLKNEFVRCKGSERHADHIDLNHAEQC